jgi:putative NADH-flavin reductase
MLTTFRALVHSVNTRLVVLICVLGLSACASQQQQPSTVPAAPAAKKNISIALLGATGLAGGYILDQALAQGYNVKALARTPKKLERYKGRITIVEGDARDTAALATLLRGSAVVISALGPVKADGQGAKMINSTVTGELIQLMPEFDIQRYILVSGAAVVMPGDDRNITGWLMRQMVRLGLHSELVDKQAEYQILAESSIEWTLVRCPVIEAQPFVHSPSVSLATPTSFWLRAGELAHFVIEQINSGEFVSKGPFVNSH